MKKYCLPVVMLVLFETIALTLWLTKDNLFYLFNFMMKYLAVIPVALLFILATNPSEFGNIFVYQGI